MSNDKKKLYSTLLASLRQKTLYHYVPLENISPISNQIMLIFFSFHRQILLKANNHRYS